MIVSRVEPRLHQIIKDDKVWLALVWRRNRAYPATKIRDDFFGGPIRGYDTGANVRPIANSGAALSMIK